MRRPQCGSRSVHSAGTACNITIVIVALMYWNPVYEGKHPLLPTSWHCVCLTPSPAPQARNCLVPPSYFTSIQRPQQRPNSGHPQASRAAPVPARARVVTRPPVAYRSRAPGKPRTQLMPSVLAPSVRCRSRILMPSEAATFAARAGACRRQLHASPYACMRHSAASERHGPQEVLDASRACDVGVAYAF
jgi:hypothetical protein